MPQIDQLLTTYSSQIFWLLVFFGIVYFVVGRAMVPRVTAAVALRDNQISGDLAAARAARDEADAREEAWRTRENENRAAAQAIVADAKADAAARREAQLAATQERLEARLKEAEARIDASRRSALSEIESVAADATQDIVARLAGVRVADAEAREAVREVTVHG